MNSSALKRIILLFKGWEGLWAPTLSWKNMVLGKGFTEAKESSTVHSTNGDFSLLKGDVKKSVINGILAIDFSNRIQKLLMSTSVILKLLGMNIGVVALQNKVYML
ncbi:hypothetical protein Goklo_028191 [Gossypium klotzschianum]|uniref:Uncharacterized protein n=1 Tax=Gossypium klotzschianum TaxID=34286 RepID=A0A7J8U0Q4_9ROSI|nr:hypothetical protein [Gossypium klotzschianum]